MNCHGEFQDTCLKECLLTNQASGPCTTHWARIKCFFCQPPNSILLLVIIIISAAGIAQDLDKAYDCVPIFFR